MHGSRFAVLIPHHASRACTPEVPDLARSVARDRPETTTGRQEVVVGSMMHSSLLRGRRARHVRRRGSARCRCGDRRVDQPTPTVARYRRAMWSWIEWSRFAHAPFASAPPDIEREPRSVSRDHADQVCGFVSDLPAQRFSPKARQTERIARIEGESNKPRSHHASLGTVAERHPPATNKLAGGRGLAAND